MQSGKAAAPPMSVTNSRRRIAALNPPIAPYHVIAENAACITAKLAGDVRPGSKLEVVASLRYVRFAPQKQTWRRSMSRSAKGHVWTRAPLPEWRAFYSAISSAQKRDWHQSRSGITLYAVVH